MCSYFWWCWMITLTCESCPPHFSFLSILQLDCPSWLLIFFTTTAADRDARETRLRAELPSFGVLPFLAFLLYSLQEKSRSLSNWSTCGHTAFCTLKSFSLLFVLLSWIGPFSVEQDFVALVLYKYWEKIKSPLTGSLAIWEMFYALIWTRVKAQNESLGEGVTSACTLYKVFYKALQGKT